MEIGYAFAYFLGGFTIDSELSAAGFASLNAADSIPRRPAWRTCRSGS